jgi:hypothetical protein
MSWIFLQNKHVLYVVLIIDHESCEGTMMRPVTASRHVKF